MNFKNDDITICMFTKQSEFKLPIGFQLFEKDVNIFELKNILKMIEDKGLGKHTHIDAYEGIDSNGNRVEYDCYYFYLESKYSIGRKCFKYNFNPDIIPINLNLKKINRLNNINYLLNNNI